MSARGEDGIGAQAELRGSQRQQELGVFRRGAHGNADRFGETHPRHGTNDDAFVQEFLAQGFGVGADGHKKKIGLAGDRGETQAAEFLEEALAFVAIGFDGANDVVGIVERGERSSLADAGDIERRAQLVHFGDQSGMADAIADAQSGEAVDLGKSAQGEDVVVFAEQLASAGKIGARGIFVVSLVENDQNVTGNFLQERGKFGMRRRPCR